MMIVWGLVWLICNWATWLGGPRWHLAWPVGVAIATVFTLVRARAGPRRRWRGLATVSVIVAYALLTGLITGIHDSLTANAMVSLLVAASYVGLGIWTGARFAWIGLGLAAMICAGWFLDRAHLELWLAIGGGGALIVTGLWLRRA